MSEELYPKPSNGSLISTFADCPDRVERILNHSLERHVKEGFCPLGARAKDFSLCTHPDWRPDLNPESKYDSGFCEVACREGVCPRGFAL